MSQLLYMGVRRKTFLPTVKPGALGFRVQQNGSTKNLYILAGIKAIIMSTLNPKPLDP